MREGAKKTVYELIPKRGALRGEVLFPNIGERSERLRRDRSLIIVAVLPALSPMLRNTSF